MIRAIGELDKLSAEENQVLDYFRQHPGATWLQAAIDLNMGEFEACRIAWKLRCEHWLIEQFQPMGQTQFKAVA